MSGADKISNEFIKNLPTEAIKLLIHIFNRILETGKIPKELLINDICLVPKPKSRALRPITLASCTLKVFGRAFLNQMEYFMETEILILNLQFRFRRGKFCQDIIAMITTEA